MPRPRNRQNRKTASHTLCGDFCDTYVVDGKIHSFLLLPKLLVDKYLAENIRAMLSPMGRAENLCEWEGTPAYRIRHKFHRAIRNRGNSATGLYGCLETIFKEEAIKAMFPNVWLLNHNERARKRNAGETAERNRARKKDPEGFALRRQCESRMQNHSASWAAREERSLMH